MLSTAKLKFVLDGDKLFALRACASGRPWWQLPLQAQYIAAPRCAAPPPLATTFRCVLLDATDAAIASITARFVAAGGEVHDANTRAVGRAGRPLRGAAGEVRGADALLFVEVRGDEERVPPLRSIAAWTARLGAAPRAADAVRRGDWERRPRRARRAAVRRPHA